MYSNLKSVSSSLLWKLSFVALRSIALFDLLSWTYAISCRLVDVVEEGDLTTARGPTIL